MKCFHGLFSVKNLLSFWNIVQNQWTEITVLTFIIRMMSKCFLDCSRSIMWCFLLSLHCRWGQDLQGRPHISDVTILKCLSAKNTFDLFNLLNIHLGSEGWTWRCSNCEYYFTINIVFYCIKSGSNYCMYLMMTLQVTGIRGRPGPMVSISLVWFTYLVWCFVSTGLAQLALDGMREQLFPAEPHLKWISSQCSITLCILCDLYMITNITALTFWPDGLTFHDRDLLELQENEDPVETKEGLYVTCKQSL